MTWKRRSDAHKHPNIYTTIQMSTDMQNMTSAGSRADIQETKTIQDGESTRYDDNLQYRLKRQTKNEFNSMQIRAPTKRQQMIAALHSSSTKPGMAFVKKDNSVSVSEPALNPSPDRAFSFPMPAEPASPVALHHRAFNFPGVDPHPDHGGHTGITASQNQDTSAKIDGTSNLDVLTKLSAPVTEQSQGTSSQNAMFKEIRKAILSHHARELLKSVMKSSPSFNSQPDLFEPRTPGTLSAGHLNYLQIRNRPLHFDRQRKPEPTNTFRNDVPEIQAGLVDVTQIEPQVHGNQDTFLNSHHEGSFSSSMMGMPLNHPISEGNSAFRIATSRVFSPVDLQPTSNGARKTGIATSGQSSLRHVGIAHGHAANQPFLTSNSHQTHRMETHAPHDRVHTVVATSTTTPSTSTTTQQPTTTKATATTTAPPSPSTTTTSQLPTAPKIGTINLNGNNPFQAIDATVTTSSSTPQSSVPHGMHISTSTNKPTFPASSGVDRVNIKTQGNAHPQVSPPHHPIINLHINFHQPTHQQPSNMAVQQHHPPQSNAQFVASGQHNSPQHIGLSRMMVPNQPNQPMIDMNVIHNITQAVVSSWLRKRHGSPVMQTHPATNINSISPVQNQQQNNNVVRAGLVSRNAVSPNRNAVTSGPVNNNAVTPGSANQNSAVSGSTNQFPLPNSSSSSIHSSIGHASSTAQNVLPHYVPAGAKTSGNQMQMSSPPHNINQQKQAHTSTVATPTVPQHHSKSNHVELNPTNTVTKPSTGQHIATSQQKSNIFQRNGNVNTAPAPIRNQQAASNANIQNSIPSTTNQKLFMSPTSGIHSTANSQTGTHVTTGNTSNIPSQTNTKMVSGTKVSNSMQGNQQGPQSTNAHNAVNTQQSERHSTASSQTSTHVTIGNTSNIPSQTNTKMVTGTRVSNSMQGNQKGSQSTNFQHVGNTQQTSSQPQPPLRETGNIHGPTTVLTSQSAADMGILMPQMLRGVHANPNGQHAAVPNIPIHHSQNQPQNLQSNIGPHVTSQQNNHVKVGNSQQVFAGAQHNGNIQNLPGSVSSSPNMQTLNLNMASMEMSALPHQPSNLASQVSSVSTSTSSQTSLSRESNSGTSHLPQPSGNTAHQSNTIGTPSTLQMSLQGTQSQTMMKSVSQQQSNGNTAGSQTLPQVSTNNARQITTLHLGQTSGHNSGHNSGTHSFMNSPGHLHPISTSSVPKASHNAVSHSSSQAQQSNVPHQSLSRSQTQSHSKMQGNQQLAGHQGIPEIMNSATHVEVISQKSSSQPQASNTSPNAMTMTTTGKAQQITERQNIMPHQSSSKSQQFNTVPASPSELLSSQSIRSNAGTGSITHQQTSTPIQFQSVASVMKPQPLGSQSVVNPTQLQSGTIASKTSLVSTNGHGSSQDTGSQTNPHIITQHSSNMIQQLNTVSTSKNREAPQNINIPVHLNGASVSSSGHVTSTNAVGNTGISSSSQKSNTTPSHVNSVHSSSNAQMPIGSHNIAHPVNVAPINEQMLQNTNIQTVMNNLPQHSSNSVQQVNTVSKSSMGTQKSLPNLPNGISRQVNSASAQMNEKLPLQNLGGITGVSKSPQQSRDIPPSQFNTVSFSSQTQQLGSQAQTRNSPQQIRDIPPSQFNTWSSSSQTQQQPGSRTPTDSLPQQPSNVVEQFNSVSRSVNGHTLQTTVPEKAERHPSLRNTHNIDQMTALTGQQQLSSQSAGQPPNNLNNQPSGQSNQGPSQSVQQSTFSSHTASQGIIGHQSNMLSSQNIQHNPSNVETSITTHTNTPPSQTKSPHSLMNGDMAITNHRNTNQQQTTNQKSNQQSNNHAVNGQSTHTITKPGTPSSSRVSSQPANIQNAFQEHLGGGQGQVSQNNQGQTLSAKSFTSRTTLRRQEFPQNNQQLTNNQGRHTPATTRYTQNIQQTNLIEQPIVNNFKLQSNSPNHITKQSGAQDKLMNSQHTKVQPQSAGHQRNALQASPNSSPSNQVNTIHEQLSSGHHGNSMPSQTSVNQGWLTLDQTMNQQNNLHHFSASKQMSSGVQSNTISSTPVEKSNPMNSKSSGISQLPVQVGQHNQKSTVSSQQITQVVTNKEPTGNREMQHRGHGNTITTQTKIPSTKNQPVQQGNTVHRSHSSSTGHNSNVNAIQNTANGHTKEFTGTSNVFASSNGQVFSPSSGSQTVMNSISQQSRNTLNSSGGQTSVVSSTKSNAPKVNTSPVSQNGIPPPSATLVQSSVNSLSFDIGSTAQTLKNGKMIENTHLSNNQVQPEINQISKIQVKRIDSKLGRTSQSQAVTQTGQVNSQIGQLSPSLSQTSQHMPITAGHQAAVSVQLTGRPKPVHKSHSKRVQQQKSAGHIQGQVGQQIGTKSHMQKNIPSPPKDQLVHQTQRQTAGVNSNRNPGQFSGQQSTVQSQQQTAKQMVGQGNTGQHQTVQSNGSPVQNTKTQVNGHARQSSSSQSTRTSSQLLQGQSNGATGQYTHAQNTATTGHKPQSPGQPNQTTTAQSKHQSNPPSTNTHENFIGELNAQKSSGPAAKVNITSQQVRSTSNLVEKPTSPNSNTRMTGSPTATHWSALTPGDTLFPFQNLQHSSPIGWVSPIVSDFNRNVQLQNSPPEVLSSSTSRISTAQVGKSQKNSPKAASGSITAQKPNTETKAMNQAQQTSNTQSAGQTQSSIIKKNVQPVASLNKMPKKANSNTIALNQHNQPNIITTVSMGKSPNQKQTSSQGVSHDITSTLRISPSMAPPSGQPSKIPNNPTTPGKHVLRIVNNALSSTGSSNTLTNVHQANNIEVSGSQGRTTNHQHKSVPSGTTPQLSQRNTNHFGNGISTSQHNQQIHAPTPQSVSIGKRQNSLPKKSATSKTVLPQTSVVVQQNAQTHGASPHRQHGHPASQTSGQSNRHSSVHMVSQNGKNTIQPASTKATSQTTTNQPIHPTKFHREIAQSGQQTNSPTMTQRRMTHNAYPSNSLESFQMEMIQNSQMTQSQMRTHQNGLQPSNPVSSKTGASQNWLQPITSSQMGSVQTFQHSIDPTSSSTRTSSQSVRNSKPSSFQMPNSQVGQTHASFTMGTSQINQRFNQPVSSSTNQMSTQMKQLNHVPSSQNGFSSVKQSKIKPPTTQTATRSHVSTHLIQHGAKQSQVDTQQNRQQQPSKSTPPKTATSMHGHHNEKRKQRNDLLQRGSKTLHVVRQPQNSPTTSTGMSFIHPQPNTVSSQTQASQPRISSSSQQRSVATLGTKSSTRSQQNSPRPLTQFSTSQTGQQQMREASSQIGLTQPAIQTNPTISTNLLTNSMTRNTIVRGQKQGSNRPGASSSTHQTRSQPTADPTGNRGTRYDKARLWV
ncbi:streptococcal hemagglutinin-like [Argopecten irradians]|uniref:streptococcal hemagglutinin-like n=1 Tax=Argopecten irradians TaxID=31199 RepID=UPI00371B37CB